MRRSDHTRSGEAEQLDDGVEDTDQPLFEVLCAENPELDKQDALWSAEVVLTALRGFLRFQQCPLAGALSSAITNYLPLGEAGCSAVEICERVRQ